MTVPVQAESDTSDTAFDDAVLAPLPLHLLGSGVDRRNMDNWLVRVSRAGGAAGVGAPPQRHLRLVTNSERTGTDRTTTSTSADLPEHRTDAAAPDAPSVTSLVVSAPPLRDALVGEVAGTPSSGLPTPPAVPAPTPDQGMPQLVEPARGYELRPALHPQAAILVAVRGLAAHAPSWAGRTDLFRSVALDIRVGELVAVVGPSGSGKTALLDCLAGIRPGDSGDVLLDGHAIGGLTSTDRARQRAGAMGFASSAVPLVSTMTVLENVELPLQLAGWSRRDARAEAVAAMTVLRLSGCGDVTPDRLSDGERRRVCVARAIVGQPRIIWADEPTAGLDPESADNVVHVLRQLNEDGVAVVVATHDAALLRHAHRIVDLRDGFLRDVSRRKVIDACQRPFR